MGYSTEEIGRRIKALREERHLSLGQLSFRAELNTSHLSMIERGLRKPKSETLRKIADAFGVPVSQLSDEESDRERAVRIAEEALDYGTANPRAEEATPVTPRPGSETYQQMIRRHFPNATPEQFAEIQRQVEAFMDHNIQEMRAINRIGDTILDLAKQRTGEGGEEEEDGEATKRKPFRPDPEEFHGDRLRDMLRAN